MAEFLAYVDGLRKEIDAFVAATRLRIAPAIELVDCGYHPQHFVPVASLATHTRKCHRDRYYEHHTSHAFFYQNEPSGVEDRTPNDGLISSEIDTASLVEPATEQDIASPNPLAFTTALEALAPDAAMLYATVQQWCRIPRAFVRLPLGDNSDTTAALKTKLTRWIQAEIARQHEVQTDDVEADLVDYVFGLLDHPDFCHPDVVTVELEEFLGANKVKAFVLALWKFVIVEIGIQILPAASTTTTGVESSPRTVKTSDNSKSHDTASTAVPTERTITLKRRRPSYRAKSTRSGPYDMVREILASSMAQLSEDTGRTIVTAPSAPVTSAVTQAEVRSTRTPEERWSEFTDPLLVRDLARNKGYAQDAISSRGRNHHQSHDRSTSPSSRHPPRHDRHQSRSQRRNHRHRSRSRSRSRRNRSPSPGRSSHHHSDRNREWASRRRSRSRDRSRRDETYRGSRRGSSDR